MSPITYARFILFVGSLLDSDYHMYSMSYRTAYMIIFPEPWPTPATHLMAFRPLGPSQPSYYLTTWPVTFYPTRRLITTQSPSVNEFCGPFFNLILMQASSSTSPTLLLLVDQRRPLFCTQGIPFMCSGPNN